MHHANLYDSDQYWKDEMAYIRKTAEKNGVCPNMLHTPATFVRYCNMQEASARRHGRPEEARQIAEISTRIMQFDAAHKLLRVNEGTGPRALLTPTCSCGWQGIGYSKASPWQHINVRDQEVDHLRTSK